jgi:hypothetical protein
MLPRVSDAVVLVGAGKGKFLLWLFEAAKRGDAGAIVVLVIGAIALAYTIWENVVKHLIPAPTTPTWYRWRLLGTLSLISFAGAPIVLWVVFSLRLPFASVLVAIAAVTTMAAPLGARLCALKCRDARKLSNASNSVDSRDESAS